MKRKYYFTSEEDKNKWENQFKKDLQYCFKMKKYCGETSKKEMYGQMIKFNFEKLNQLKNNSKYIVL